MFVLGLNKQILYLVSTVDDLSYDLFGVFFFTAIDVL